MSSTESEEETHNLSPMRKRQKKGHLSIEMKEAIFNVYVAEKESNPYVLIDAIVQNAARKVGVSRASVYRIVREYKDSRTFSKPATNQNRNSCSKLLDDTEKHAIRRKVHEFFFKSEIPTQNKVMQLVNEDALLPNFKQSTFHSLLIHDLQFKSFKRGRYRILMDRHKIVLWRREYLTKIKAYRNENRKIYYLDEVWVNASHTTNVEKTVTSERANPDVSLEPKNPTGKGKRVIFCHIGSEDGFVDDGLWCFEEMSDEAFENWFFHILSRLEDNCVIVLDSAPYHSRQVDKIPTMATEKKDIQNWLRVKGIDFDESYLKLQLLALVKQHKCKKFIIDEKVKSQNKIILRLPPYHSNLNPIEFIWAEAKNFVAQYNKTYILSDVTMLFKIAFQNITQEKWQECIEHVKQEEEVKMWKLDNIIDTLEERLIINKGDDLTSSSSE